MKKSNLTFQEILDLAKQAKKYNPFVSISAKGGIEVGSQSFLWDGTDKFAPAGSKAPRRETNRLIAMLTAIIPPPPEEVVPEPTAPVDPVATALMAMAGAMETNSAVLAEILHTVRTPAHTQRRRTHSSSPAPAHRKTAVCRDPQCPKCGGTGFIPALQHRWNGKCFGPRR